MCSYHISKLWITINGHRWPEFWVIWTHQVSSPALAPPSVCNFAPKVSFINSYIICPESDRFIIMVFCFDKIAFYTFGYIDKIYFCSWNIWWTAIVNRIFEIIDQFKFELRIFTANDIDSSIVQIEVNISRWYWHHLKMKFCFFVKSSSSNLKWRQKTFIAVNSAPMICSCPLKNISNKK